MTMRTLPTLGLAVLTVLSVLLLGVSGAPFVAADAARRGESPLGVAVPAAGGTVCVTGSVDADVPVDLLLLAAPDEPAATADQGDAAPTGPGASVLAVTAGDGLDPATVGRTEFGPVGPGELVLLDATRVDDVWTWVGWMDRPVAAWQEWRTDGAPGGPRGAVASACLPTEPRVQTLLGLRTDGSHEALLRVANPFDADASFAVTLVTPDGAFAPVALRNVSVRGGQQVTIRLNDHLPEEPDIVAIVSVGAGRLAVEGLQRSLAALGGAEGLATVPPVTQVATAWSFPWLPVGPDVEASVWVLNPSSRAVTLGLTVHTDEGATVPAGLDSVAVGPGAAVRIDAADLVPDVTGTVGVTLRSDTAGVLAAAGAAFLAGDAARSGLVRLAGAADPDPEWVVAGRGAPDRETVLHVLNLDEVEVRPRVVLSVLDQLEPPEQDAVPEGDAEGATDGAADGDASGDADGGGDAAEPAPEDALPPAGARPVPFVGPPATQVLEGAPIAPGAVGRIVLPTGGARAWSAVVDGGRALVVARTTTGRELLEPVATAATPSAGWRLTRRTLGGLPRDGWVGVLGTDADRRRDPRLLVPDGDALPLAPR